MYFLQYYGAPFQVVFYYLLVGTFIFLFDIAFIIYAKGYKIFAVRLFIYLCISQLVIFVPQLLIPFLTNRDGDPKIEDIISPLLCQIQGACILSGWMSSSALAIYMEYCVLIALEGNVIQSDVYHEAKVLSIITIVSIVPNIITSITGQFTQYGWHYQREVYYQFCQLNVNIAQAYGFILVFLDIVAVGSMIYYLLKINRRLKVLRKVGFRSNHPIMKVYIFSLALLVFWTINGAVKAAEAEKWYHADNPVLDVIWQILNLLIGLEPITMTVIFFYFFLPYLESNLKQTTYRILASIVYCRCLKRKKSMHISLISSANGEGTDRPQLLGQSTMSVQFSPQTQGLD